MCRDAPKQVVHPSAANVGFVPLSSRSTGLWALPCGERRLRPQLGHSRDFHERLVLAKAVIIDTSQLATAAEQSLPDWLVTKATLASQTASDAIDLAGRVIVVPEFIGNRSPFADPNSKAIIAGLGFEHDLESLLALYLAGISGLGYGLRQIIETQRTHNVRTDTIVISGGAGQSRLIRQLLADATGVAVAEPSSDEPVLLGAAMLGAVAANAFDSIRHAMAQMSGLGEILAPTTGKLATLHLERYETFRALQCAARLNL